MWRARLPTRCSCCSRPRWPRGGVGLSSAVLSKIRAAGGFTLWPLPATLAAPAQVPGYLLTTGRGLLLLFGANFFHHTVGFVAGLAACHLVGLGLAAWATCWAIRHWPGCDLPTALLASGIVIILAAYAFGTRAADLPS